jgi:hypothetical protein
VFSWKGGYICQKEIGPVLQGEVVRERAEDVGAAGEAEGAGLAPGLVLEGNACARLAD